MSTLRCRGNSVDYNVNFPLLKSNKQEIGFPSPHIFTFSMNYSFSIRYDVNIPETKYFNLWLLYMHSIL